MTSEVNNNTLAVYLKPVCGNCKQAKNFLETNGIPFQEIDIVADEAAKQFMQSQGHERFPQIYLNGKPFVEGGWAGLSQMTIQEIQDKLQQSAAV